MTQPMKATSFENLEALFKAYPDLKEEVQQSVSHGDFVSIEANHVVQPQPLTKASLVKSDTSKITPPEVNAPRPKNKP